MLRPPSNQKPHDLFWSRDPALIPAPTPNPLPDNASAEQKAERDKRFAEQTAEHKRRLTVALDTGHWGDVTVAGEQLTRFTMRPLPAEAFGELAGMLVNGIAPFRVWVLAFRIALRDAAPLTDGVSIDFERHDAYGKVATLTFLEKCGLTGELGALLASELGELVFERARNVDPKS